MKILKLFLISLMALIPFAVTSFAGNASTYIITIQRVQLLKDDGVTWVTIAEPNQEVDIAAVGQNAVAHAFSNITIPPGNYINFKTVNSETMRYSGSDQGFYTLAEGALTLTGDGTVNSTADWITDPPQAQITIAETSNTCTNVAGQQGEVTATLNIHPNDGDNYIEIYRSNNLTTPIVINENSQISMFFDFNTQNTVHYVNPDAIPGNADDAVFFTPPQEGTKFQITVDGVTTTITNSEMRIDF